MEKKSKDQSLDFCYEILHVGQRIKNNLFLLASEQIIDKLIIYLQLSRCRAASTETTSRTWLTQLKMANTTTEMDLYFRLARLSTILPWMQKKRKWPATRWTRTRGTTLMTRTFSTRPMTAPMVWYPITWATITRKVGWYVSLNTL